MKYESFHLGEDRSVHVYGRDADQAPALADDLLLTPTPCHAVQQRIGPQAVCASPRRAKALSQWATNW